MSGVKPVIDTSRLLKAINKTSSASIGFSDPKFWISTGNYALNYRISGDPFKGIPLGKVSVFAGESGSGKSYITAGNIIREAQKQNIFCVIFDSENALDEEWLRKLGVDTNPEKLLKVNISLIDDVSKIINELIKDYVEKYQNHDEEEKPKMLIVVDSLGMLLTKSDVEQFESGDLKGDMGRKAKALTALVRNCVNKLGNLNIGLVATNHTYASQDMFDPEDKISGGQGFIYASSIVVAMKKLKLKEDEEGNKTKDISGIRAKCKVMKTRFTKPFKEIEIKIPYEKGMDPYSGLFDILLEENIIQKEGNKYVYVSEDGTEHKYFEKQFHRNENNILDIILKEKFTKKEVESRKNI